MLCDWSKFRSFFTWHEIADQACTQFTFIWSLFIAVLNNREFLNISNFITVFTWDSFQVDTNRFLKGCLTKGLWRVERMWTTENFQVCIAVGQNTIARSRWEAYKLLWLAVENTQLRNDYYNCRVSNLKICCLIEIVRFSTWSAWSSGICEWNHLRTLSDHSHLSFTQQNRLFFQKVWLTVACAISIKTEKNAERIQWRMGRAGKQKPHIFHSGFSLLRLSLSKLSWNWI